MAPFTTRTTPLGVTSWGNQVRVYGQAESGDLREAVADLSMTSLFGGQVQDGFQEQFIPLSTMFFGNMPMSFKLKDRNWRSGRAHGAGVPGTAIAPVQSNEGRHIRIYFQTPDLRLGELCNDNLDNNWFMGEYKTDVAMPGTSIAVLQDPSLGSFGYHVFFQGKDGGIWMSSHRDWWEQPRKILDKAMSQTAIAVVNWNNGSDARLYYQDVSGSIRELCRGSDRGGSWTPGGFATSTKSLADFCAVCWEGPQIRVYIQEPSNDIIEWQWNNGWSQTDFRCPALPGTDITAVLYRAPRDQILSLIYFVGPDRILHEKVQYIQVNRGNLNKAWDDIKYVATTAQSGDFAGTHTGTQFTDLDAGVGDKRIKRVRVNSGWWLDSISLEFTDGSKTGQRGGNGGGRGVFELNEGEDIVQVLIRGGDTIGTIQFVTSTGRKSQQFGTTENGRLQLWEYQGQPLAGFNGSYDGYLRSLTPMWANREPRVGGKVLQDLSNESNQISRDKDNISSQVQRFNTVIPKLQADLSSTIKGPCDVAINNVTKLGNVVKDLDVAAGAAKRTLIANSKAISIQITKDFESVHTIAQNNMNDLNKQSTDVVYWESQADSKLTRIQEMVLIADATSKCAEVLKEIKLKAVEIARQDIAAAQAARRQAERQKEEKKTARIVRDIFTFGLGEAGDWGGLNSAIESADSIIRASEANERAANAGMAQAQATVNESNRDLQAFKDLQGKLNGFNEPLRNLRSTLDGQRLKIADIVKIAFDICVFVGSMAATSAPLESIRSAADLAKGIQKLQDLIQTNAKLAGPFISNPNIMDSGLKAIIAAADVPPGDLI